MQSSRKIKKENKFYVYLHVKETNGEPFYVGKGCGRRKNSKSNRNRWWHFVVDKHGFDVIILEDNLSEEDAEKIEIYWTKRIGRADLGHGTLVNTTDGGGGISGYKHTDEAKKRMREAHLGNTYCLGNKLSDEHKNNIRLANKDKPKSPEHVQKVREKLIGYPYEGITVLDVDSMVYYISISDAARHNDISISTLYFQLKKGKNNRLKIV